MPDLVGLVAVMMTFGIPMVAIITSHQRKLAEIQANRPTNQASASTSEIEALRRQIAELRDTTTNFDLSFDTALQRIEQRVTHLEQKSTSADDQPLSQRS
ncbi:MAG: hypothetical protein NT029_15460 [Armatimonadetes bacterium]|nr:hypothetical protein [Armatimonadota bacterium]